MENRKRMTLTDKYFPLLTPLQKERFAALDTLYGEWNARINVISRKDIDNLQEHHVLHSLAIAKAVQFLPGEKILDLGTGGGFPGIPLAIMFPETEFTLCDSIGKKVKVASAVAESLGLDNVRCENCRVETLIGPYDHIVSRAVAQLQDVWSWIGGRYTKSLICLKGGDLEREAEECARRHKLSLKRFTISDVSLWFEEEYFIDKKILILK